MGIDLRIGQVLSAEEKVRIAKAMADLIIKLLRREPLSHIASELLITSYLTYQGNIDEIIFSGGVAEYIYGYEKKEYGDLGLELAKEIKDKIVELRMPVGEGTERIRATAKGASQFTIQVSSSTIFLSDSKLLPIYDLLVIKPDIPNEIDNLEPNRISEKIFDSFKRFDLLDRHYKRPFALFVQCPIEITPTSIKILAKGVKKALNAYHANPWILILDKDIGGIFGYLLKNEMQVGSDLVVLDEIHVRELEFVDIGPEIKKTGSVPIIVKSLIF